MDFIAYIFISFFFSRITWYFHWLAYTYVLVYAKRLLWMFIEKIMILVGVVWGRHNISVNKFLLLFKLRLIFFKLWFWFITNSIKIAELNHWIMLIHVRLDYLIESYVKATRSPLCSYPRAWSMGCGRPTHLYTKVKAWVTCI